MLCINNDRQTNFKSTIRIVNQEDFLFQINRIFRNEVKYPWGIKESLLCKDVYTRGVFDCGVVGITNGTEALLMHICPTEPVNMGFDKIREFILEKIDILRNEYIQGFILGGKSNPLITKSPRSMEYINNYCEILQKEGVPFSKLTGGNYWNDAAYFTEKDLWLIGNERADDLRKTFKENPLAAAKIIFEDVKICDLDELCW